MVNDNTATFKESYKVNGYTITLSNGDKIVVENFEGTYTFIVADNKRLQYANWGDGFKSRRQCLLKDDGVILFPQHFTAPSIEALCQALGEVDASVCDD